jgi:hypothetical protein
MAASIVPIAMPAHTFAFDTPPAPRAVPPADEFFSFVYDVRFHDAALLASKAERSGLPVTRIFGDITDFWFDELSLKWREAPVPVAGFTAMGPLFCLERLGWDHGMRVVFRGVHRDAAGGHDELLSWVIAPRLANRLDDGSR